jgi:hypothetical protein
METILSDAVSNSRSLLNIVPDLLGLTSIHISLPLDRQPVFAFPGENSHVRASCLQVTTGKNRSTGLFDSSIALKCTLHPQKALGVSQP